MPQLARRRDPNARHECWRVYYGDIIGLRAGMPPDVAQWGWSCGFYPGCGPGEHRSSSAPDFETARRDFETAWRVLSARRTEADYQAWRDQRDWTERK
jgi:hypothetical protein